MPTIAEATDTLRSLIKAHGDDTPYESSLLYILLLNAKATLLTQRSKKFNKISSWTEQCFCIKLEKQLIPDCPCVDIGCEAMVSCFPIPPVITGRNRDLITFRDLGHNKIDKVTYNELNIRQTNEIQAGKPAITINGGKIELWNSNMDVILVCGVWEDITQWQDLTCVCKNEDGSEIEEPCLNLDDIEIGLSRDLLDVAYELVLNKLRLPLSLTEDITNDSSDVIKT